MKSAVPFLLCLAVAVAPCFAAEPVIRVKAKITRFDGRVMTLEPVLAAPEQPTGLGRILGAKPPAPAPQESFTVSVLPETRYVASDRTALETIKPGDYAGAAVQETGGVLKAQDVYLYAEALRGSGEGRFPESGRLIVNGTVREVKSAADPKGDNGLTLHYRGAMLSGTGTGRAVCEGRASPPAYASALACEADAVIQVPSGTPVSALTVGDKSLLAPGRVVTVAMTKTSDGKNVAPGIIVEKPQSPP